MLIGPGPINNACLTDDPSPVPYVSVRVCVLLNCVLYVGADGACARKAAVTVAHESESVAGGRRRGRTGAARRRPPAPHSCCVFCVLNCSRQVTVYCTPYTPGNYIGLLYV